jgi:5-methylcytosine-specific restriction endonuclease McrA
MATPAANANGHRRRQLRARVLAEESHCAICGHAVDKTLGMARGRHGPRCPGAGCTGCVPDDMRAEVDEDLPRSRGGSPYERSNCRLMHRACNRAKSNRTIAEYMASLQAQPKRTTTNLIAW